MLVGARGSNEVTKAPSRRPSRGRYLRNIERSTSVEPRVERRGLIDDEGAALDYEGALEAILSLVGQRVEVTVISRDPLGVVAKFAGELTRGQDARPPSRASEGEAFRVAVGPDNSLSVEARMFREAGWVRLGTPKGSLRLYLGATVVEVSPEPR